MPVMSRLRHIFKGDEDEQITLLLTKTTSNMRFGIAFESADSGHAWIINPGAWSAVGLRPGDKVLSINKVSVQALPTKAEHAARMLQEAHVGAVLMLISRPLTECEEPMPHVPTSGPENVEAVELARRARRCAAWRPEVDTIWQNHPQWVCPLTWDVFRDPVVASDGQTCTRRGAWLTEHRAWAQTHTQASLERPM